MKKIIIFTDYIRLKKVNHQKEITENNINAIQNTEILVLNENNSFVEAISINDGSIFLLKDTILNNTFKKFLIDYNKAEIGILKHRFPDWDPQTFDGFITPLEGQHDWNGKFYPDVLRILLNKEENKFEQLNKIVFKFDPLLEEKMKIKNQILNGVIPKIEIQELKEYQPFVDKFSSFKNYPILSPEYSQAFEQLLKDLKIED